MKLLIGNPTGHEDQRQCTLMVGHTMLRGPLSARDRKKLNDALEKGCRATGQEYASATLNGVRRENAKTE